MLGHLSGRPKTSDRRRKLWPSRRDFYGQFGEDRSRANPHTGGGGIEWQACKIHTKRIPDMDLEGIDVAVLFGTFVGLGAIAAIKDPGLAMAVATAITTG